MKGYTSYYKKKNKKARYLFLAILIIAGSYFLVSNISKMSFFDSKKKNYSTIEQLITQYDKEKTRSKRKIILNKLSKSLNKIINKPKLQQDGYLSFLAGSINFRKGLTEFNKELRNMYLDKSLYYYRKSLALLVETKDSGRLHYELGKCYFYKGEYYYHESMFELNKAKELDYDSKNIDKIITIMQYKKGDIKDINKVLAQFQDSEKDEVESYFYDAMTYKNNKDYIKAIDIFLKIEDLIIKKRVEIQEKTYIIFKTLYSLGWLYYNEQDYSKAEEYYNKAIHYEDKNPDIYYWLGKVYIANKKKKQARSMFEKALAIDPNHSEAKLKLKQLRR